MYVSLQEKMFFRRPNGSCCFFGFFFRVNECISVSSGSGSALQKKIFLFVSLFFFSFFFFFFFWGGKEVLKYSPTMGLTDITKLKRKVQVTKPVSLKFRAVFVATLSEVVWVPVQCIKTAKRQSQTRWR